MRFRYFDASGEEVRVSSVDALKFRISTGAVTTETLLYDSAIDQWAPAEEHAVFRFLTEEDELDHPSAEVEPGEEGSQAEQPAPAQEAPSSRSQDGGGSSSPRLRPGEGHVVLSLEEESAPEPEDEDAPAVKKAPSRSPGPDSARRATSHRSTLPPPSPSVVSSDPHQNAPRGKVFERSGTTIRRFGAAAVLLAAAVSAVLLVRGGEGDEGAALAVAGELNSFLSSDPSATMGESADIVALPSAEPEVAAESEAVNVPAPIDAPMDELASEVAAAATGDLELALMDLKLALDVPDRPPEIWLHGRYLAAADSFPGVRSYWQSVAAYVTAMQELDEDLYRGFVESRVLRMRLDTARAADLSALALERYQRTASQRSETFRNLTELTGLALQLHDVLAFRSADIAYEPFDSRSLSRDPVVEAVADDPELAQEIWSNLDGIFNRLEDLQGLGPVSTALLQDAVLEELRGEEGGA